MKLCIKFNYAADFNFHFGLKAFHCIDIAAYGWIGNIVSGKSMYVCTTALPAPTCT